MLKANVEMVTNTFNTKPQILRSDNGGEYSSQQVQQYFREKAIRHEHTMCLVSFNVFTALFENVFTVLFLIWLIGFF